jgi:hypothetical protein
MGEERKVYKVLVGKSEGKEVWIGFDWLRIRTSGECGDEPSGSSATELVSSLVI